MLYGVHTSQQDGTAELDEQLRASVKCAITISRLSAAQIADQLTERLHRPIKEGLVYAWMAPAGHKWHLPADAVPHLCEILGDDSIQRLLLSEKLRQSLELGESTPRVVALLRSALPEATERKEVEGGKKPKRSKR